MEPFEGLEQDLDNNGYKIGLYKTFTGIEILFRRHFRGTQKDHGRMCLSKNDLDKFIENLEYMRAHLED